MEAWADAGSPEVDPERLGVDFATGIGGVWTLLDAWDTLREKGPRRVMPMTVPMLMPNAAAGNLSLHFGARAYARTVASACASSTESIVNAVEHLRDGLADVVIAGGTESAIHPITIASFASMQALSRRNDDPAHASRPGSIDRDGFVMGEGAGVLILETEEHARARGAKIYAVVVGGGVTADSYHITANDPEGTGRRAPCARPWRWRMPLPTTSRTSTRTRRRRPVGDPNEYVALKTVFGDRIDDIPVSATKASTGHLLGGTGALEAIFTVLALRDRVAPPTINLTDAGSGGARSGSPVTRNRSATVRSSRSATRSASAATTPSSRSHRREPTKTPPGSHRGASVVSGGDSRSRHPGFSPPTAVSGASPPEVLGVVRGRRALTDVR